MGRVLEDHGGKIELHDAADIRPGQRGAWMRLRFAISGHAPKAEIKELAGETKPPASETIEAQETTKETTDPDTTNKETRIEAATGN